MKKLIVVLLVLIFGVTLIAGCGGDKSGSDKSGDSKGGTENATLIGEWEYLSLYIFSFNEDGTGYSSVGDMKNEFVYEEKDGKLDIGWVFSGEVYTHEEYKYSIKGQELTLEEPDGSISVYTKK